MTEATWPYPTSDEVSHLAVEEVPVLRARIDQLLEERANRELAPASFGERQWPIDWKLTPGEGRLVEALLEVPDGRVVSKDMLHRSIILDEGTEANIVNVRVCKVRKKLAPFGVGITTHWGRGYSLDPAGRAILEAA